MVCIRQRNPYRHHQYADRIHNCLKNEEAHAEQKVLRIKEEMQEIQVQESEKAEKEIVGNQVQERGKGEAEASLEEFIEEPEEEVFGEFDKMEKYEDGLQAGEAEKPAQGQKKKKHVGAFQIDYLILYNYILLT